MKTTEALGALHLNSSTIILEITNYGGILGSGSFGISNDTVWGSSKVLQY